MSEILRISDRWYPVANSLFSSIGVWRVLVKGEIDDCAAYCGAVQQHDYDGTHSCMMRIAQEIAQHGDKISEAEALAIFGDFGNLKYRD